MIEKMKKLKLEGKSYSEIARLLNVHHSTVIYHCDPKRKDQKIKQARIRRSKQHPFIIKRISFLNEENKDIKRTLYLKLRHWHRDCQIKGQTKMNFDFTLDQLIEKIGPNPVCYLTGEPIDIYKTTSYQFDHKIPVSRGGNNSLDNLEICTAQVNMAKRNLTPDEFYELCSKVFNFYKASANSAKTSP